MDNYDLPISAAFPFQSKFIEIKKYKLHYVDEGNGDPILFLHGIPTSCYIWRNIIPFLSTYGRCIAPDLIGMGKSDKPNIQYNVFDHIDYIEAFIKALKLQNITLVLHGLGSVVGFNYASNNKNNVKGIAFYESHTHPILDWNSLSLPLQHLFMMLQNSKAACYKAIVNNNYLIKKILPGSALRKLSPEELINYTEPFSKPKHRQPLWQYIVDCLSNIRSSNINKLIHNYTKYLQTNLVPKLLLYSVPGFLTTIEMVKSSKNNFPNLKLVDLGEGHHLVQETNPQLFAAAIKDWYIEL
jgi:haloalkane dehalogenase